LKIDGENVIASDAVIALAASKAGSTCGEIGEDPGIIWDRTEFASIVESVKAVSCEELLDVEKLRAAEETKFDPDFSRGKLPNLVKGVFFAVYNAVLQLFFDSGLDLHLSILEKEVKFLVRMILSRFILDIAFSPFIMEQLLLQKTAPHSTKIN